MEAKADTIGRLSASGTADEEFLQCPTCECKLQHWEVKGHFEQEMKRLSQLQKKAVSEANACDAPQQSASSNAATYIEERQRNKPWTIFQRVQRNRHTRFRRRTGGKRPSQPPPPPVPAPVASQCPMCNANFPPNEIQQHAEQCLRRSNGAINGRRNGGGGGDGSSNEDDDGEEYEEYEWAGQKRIRVSSLLRGGYAGIGVGQTLTNHSSSGAGQSNNHIGGGNDDEEEDLNVDEDDTQLYGPAQYSETDVISTTAENTDDANAEDGDVTNYMRRLITGTESTNNGNINVVEPRRHPAAANINGAHANNTDVVCITQTAPNLTPSTAELARDEGKPEKYPQIIESLKGKLRHYENQAQNKFKCLICLDDYKNPAISVACWHVHCEECWLRSLGARKLCPQCNLITTPKDLRRIYM